MLQTLPIPVLWPYVPYISVSGTQRNNFVLFDFLFFFFVAITFIGVRFGFVTNERTNIESNIAIESKRNRQILSVFYKSDILWVNLSLNRLHPVHIYRHTNTICNYDNRATWKEKLIFSHTLCKMGRVKFCTISPERVHNGPVIFTKFIQPRQFSNDITTFREWWLAHIVHTCHFILILPL